MLIVAIAEWRLSLDVSFGVLLRFKPLILRFKPLVGTFLSLFFTQAISLLQFAGEFIPASLYIIQVVVGEIAPFLFDGTFHLFPFSALRRKVTG